MADFKRAENELQSILDEVSVEIGTAVSEHVKVPTGNHILTVCLHAEAAAVQAEAADVKCPDETGRLVFYI